METTDTVASVYYVVALQWERSTWHSAPEFLIDIVGWSGESTMVKQCVSAFAFPLNKEICTGPTLTRGYERFRDCQIKRKRALPKDAKHLLTTLPCLAKKNGDLFATTPAGADTKIQVWYKPDTWTTMSEEKGNDELLMFRNDGKDMSGFGWEHCWFWDECVCLPTLGILGKYC